MDVKLHTINQSINQSINQLISQSQESKHIKRYQQSSMPSEIAQWNMPKSGDMYVSNKFWYIMCVYMSVSNILCLYDAANSHCSSGRTGQIQATTMTYTNEFGKQIWVRPNGLCGQLTDILTNKHCSTCMSWPTSHELNAMIINLPGWSCSWSGRFECQ